MFQFPTFPSLARRWDITPNRFPDLGHLRVKACLAAHRSFSQLNHVLRRLWTPRHPPYTLSNLPIILTRYATRFSQFTLFSKSTSNSVRCCANFHDSGLESGGGEGTRTHDRLVANQVLYQLSYAPTIVGVGTVSKWWAWEDLNLRPPAYQADALTN